MNGTALEPTVIKDYPLPDTVSFWEITDAPQTLQELNQSDGDALDSAVAITASLGDLAFEDLVTELQLANSAVTNAKIAVDAIQGDVIAANAITSTKIEDNAISSAKIAAGAIVAGKIAAGAIVANDIQAGTITGDRIAGGTITTNKLQAGEIIGFTITGSLIRTSSTGTRVQMNNSTNALEIYSGSVKRAHLYDQGMTFWDSSGNNVASIYAGSTGSLLITTVDSGSTARNIHLQAGSTGVASIGIEGVHYFYAQGSDTTIRFAKDFQPTFPGLDIGGAPFNVASISVNDVLSSTLWSENNIGYVNDDGTEGSPFPDTGFSVSRASAGKYTVIHPLGTTEYVVVATALRASGAGAYSCKIEERLDTDFKVTVFDDSGTATDGDFMFIFIPKTPA